MQPLLSKSTLMVVANPFAAALDAAGQPCGFVQYDPEHAGGTGPQRVRYIGCRLNRKQTERSEVSPARAAKDWRIYPRVETKVVYNLEPTPIAHSAYHVKLVRAGALFAADEATARLCGAVGPKTPFRAPTVRLEEAATERIHEWCDANPGATVDPGSWKAVGVVLAPRAPVAASTIEERLAARAAGAKLAESDGVAKTPVPGPVLTASGGDAVPPPIGPPESTGGNEATAGGAP